MLLATVACGPPPQPSGFQPIGTTAAKAVAHAKHSPEHRATVLGQLTRCKERQQTTCEPVLDAQTKAIIHDVLVQTASMNAPPAIGPRLHVPLDVFRELLEAGAVRMPAPPAAKVGAPIAPAPPSMLREYIAKDETYKQLTWPQGHDGFVYDGFAKYKLLVEHGWPLDELDLLFAAYIAPDTDEVFALVEDVFRRLGRPPESGSYRGAAALRRPERTYRAEHFFAFVGDWARNAPSLFLTAAQLEKRVMAAKMLERGIGAKPTGASAAATGQSWVVELAGHHGGTQQGTCISSDMLPIVETLVAQGADPNQRCANGQLPLTGAFSACKLDAAAFLLDHGARGDADSVHAAIGAESRRCRSTRADASPAALLGRTLAPGTIDLNTRNLQRVHGDSLVHVAARADLAGTVKALLDAGARVDRKNALEEMPLDVAGPAVAAMLRSRGAPSGDPSRIAERRAEARQTEARQRQQAEVELRRLEALEDAERRREREEEREARAEQARQRAEERAEQAREQRARDEREARARRDMPNTGVDTDAFRRWALGGSQGTARPSGNPSGVGRGASSPAPPPPPNTRAGNAGAAGGREAPARAGSSSASSPPPARALPSNVCADWSSACQPYRNKRDACEARCQQDVGRSISACVEQRAAGEKGVKYIQATTECQRELEPTKKACGPRCAYEHRCPTPQPPDCRGSGGNGGTAL